MGTEQDDWRFKFGEWVQMVFGMGGGAIKNMNILFFLVGLLMLGSSFFVWPYLPFAFMVILAIWFVKAHYRLLVEHPELFQEGKIWWLNQKTFIGKKGEPLTELIPNTPLFTPISQEKTSAVKASTQIIKGKP